MVVHAQCGIAVHNATMLIQMGHVNNIPTLQSLLDFPEILSQNHILSVTECVWDFQTNALWDTRYHALLLCNVCIH